MVGKLFYLISALILRFTNDMKSTMIYWLAQLIFEISNSCKPAYFGSNIRSNKTIDDRVLRSDDLTAVCQ